MRVSVSSDGPMNLSLSVWCKAIKRARLERLKRIPQPNLPFQSTTQLTGRRIRDLYKPQSKSPSTPATLLNVGKVLGRPIAKVSSSNWIKFSFLLNI